jgi:hypothetical protein
LFQKNSQLDVESELNHKQIGKMYMRQSFLYPALKFIDYFKIQLYKKSKYRPSVPKTPFEKNCVLIIYKRLEYDFNILS